MALSLVLWPKLKHFCKSLDLVAIPLVLIHPANYNCICMHAYACAFSCSQLCWIMLLRQPLKQALLCQKPCVQHIN